MSLKYEPSSEPLHRKISWTEDPTGKWVVKRGILTVKRLDEKVVGLHVGRAGAGPILLGAEQRSSSTFFFSLAGIL